jgi:hypothetical protein
MSKHVFYEPSRNYEAHVWAKLDVNAIHSRDNALLFRNVVTSQSTSSTAFAIIAIFIDCRIFLDIHHLLR